MNNLYILDQLLMTRNKLYILDQLLMMRLMILGERYTDIPCSVNISRAINFADLSKF